MIRANRNNTTSHGIAVDSEFVQSLNHYFAVFKPDAYDVSLGTFSKKQEFVEAVNEKLQEIAGRNPIRAKLTEDIFSQMLAGEVSPTAELIEALHDAFNLYSEERNRFIASGKKAIGDGFSRWDKAWYEAPEQKEAMRLEDIANTPSIQREVGKQAAIKRIMDNREAWRANNPKHMHHLRSFQEMLEISHEKGEDFRTFLFDRVLPTWDRMSQVKFCELLETSNADKDIPKRTITDTLLSQWHKDAKRPIRESVNILCSAFGITPDKGELMALHEKMLWQTISGHPFSWGNEKGIAAIDMAIADCRKSGETGALVSELMAASGISFERLEELLNVRQLAEWKHGAKIEDINKALQFLSIVNPQPTEEIAHHAGVSRTVSRQNRGLLSLITGREFDIDVLLEKLRNAPQGNPGGALFAALTGRHGLVTISNADLGKHFVSYGLSGSETKIFRMRSSKRLQRGADISEPYANAILDILEERMQPLIAMDVTKPLSQRQRERCIELFTGVAHPKKILQECVEHKSPIGTLIRKTCERLGMNLTSGENSFEHQVGVHSVSDFSLGKKYLQRDTAKRIADWFAEHYAFDEGEQQQFIALATSKGLWQERVGNHSNGNGWARSKTGNNDS